MTLLNRASDGMASVLVAIFRGLRQMGPTSRDDLVGLLAPGSMEDEARKSIRETLNRWQQIGLLEDSGAGLMIHAAFSQARYGYDSPLLDDFRRITLDLVIEKGKEDVDLVDDAIVGMWWLLTLDPFSDPIRSWDDAQRVLNRDFPKSILVVNDTRWQGLIEWATLWGLIQPPGASSVVIPCPAEAIGWHLPELLPTREPTGVKQFLVALSQRLPIVPPLVDGRIEGPLAPKVPAREPSTAELSARLSVSLSLALHTLKEAGRVELKTFDTAEKWYFSDVEDSVTHIVRI